MFHSNLISRICSIAVIAALTWAARADAAAPDEESASIAFYYGANLPVSALSQFDRVVVQADQVTPAELERLRKGGSEVFAYISLSEVSVAQASGFDVRWQLGKNADWSTLIMDARQPEWRQALLDRGFQPLWERGFRSFFLDNLDSYERVAKTAEARAAQVQGLLQIIKEVRARFPGSRLLLNRGFELLPGAAPLAVGIVAESLFRSFIPAKKEYIAVREIDRQALLAELVTARDRYHLPVTVVDYAPPADRMLMRATARRIAALGMTPWISDHALTTVGIGAIEGVPRRILALYNGAEQRDRGEFIDVAYTPVHTMAAVVLEYLGYAIDYVDVRGSLPAGPLGERYAGIVTWFTDDRIPHQSAYREWLTAQLDSGMRVAIFDHLGVTLDPALRQRLGIGRRELKESSEVRLLAFDHEVIGFEAPAEPRQNVFHSLEIQDGAARRLLSVADRSGARMDAVFTASWGGMALHPYLLSEGYDHSYRWIVNPFAFFKQALALPDLPAPDVTTVGGRRMLIVHIDGDGFPSRARMPGNDYAGKVILDHILKRYPVKATVSIIEGETGKSGKWPALSPALELIARDIFALPNVEVASHSYSHPFDWLRYGRDQEDGDINGMFRYEFSMEREVDGSIAYINGLAPPRKPVKVFLWSGEAIAPALALARTQAAGLLNMNGGNTIISSRNPSLTNVSPMGRPVAGYYQTYAPVQNENVYTNLWRGPFYGFRDVISTFELTDWPRRLKPINIYFHFYSGSKIGSLKVLRQVFDWALRQDPSPVFASEYIRKVEDFQKLSLARRLDGCWQVRSDGSLTTLRLSPAAVTGAVDLARSRGVTAVSELAQGRYVELDGSGRATLCLGASRPASVSTSRRSEEE